MKKEALRCSRKVPSERSSTLMEAGWCLNVEVFILVLQSAALALQYENHLDTYPKCTVLLSQNLGVGLIIWVLTRYSGYSNGHCKLRSTALMVSDVVTSY